jgi:kynureninase
MKQHFSRFLNATPGRLHFAAHSHHPWPDVSFDAQQRAWLDAAEFADHKWDKVFGEVLPAVQEHARRLLGLPDAGTIAFAPNTHELVKRVFSCLPGRAPHRILTTDSEFHSFERQARRWEEAGEVTAERVPTEPFATFADRFAERVRDGDYDILYVSHVFFNSGRIFAELSRVLADAPEDAWIVVDGYHAFCAMPVDIGALADRVFYLGGGYKYAMAGEGACLMHCPPGWATRPVDTGWFAGFGSMQGRIEGVPYAEGGNRFLGATADPTAWYRLRAVQDLWLSLGFTPADGHAHAHALQRTFLDGLGAIELPGLSVDNLVVPDAAARGNYLTFRTAEAGALYRRLTDAGIVVDRRDDRLRFGFGIYQDESDVAELIGRLGRLRQTG